MTDASIMLYYSASSENLSNSNLQCISHFYNGFDLAHCPEVVLHVAKITNYFFGDFDAFDVMLHFWGV